jgi:hypothetical protein
MQEPVSLLPRQTPDRTHRTAPGFPEFPLPERNDEVLPDALDGKPKVSLPYPLSGPTVLRMVSSNPPPVPSSTSSLRSSHSKRLRRGWVPLVVVVAVLAVTAFLIGPFGGPFDIFRPPTGAPAFQTFLAAYQTGAQLAESTSGGPWALYGAYGIGGTAALVQPGSAGPPGCPFPPLAIPASSTTNISHGIAPVWIFDFIGSGSGSLVLEVMNGRAAVFNDWASGSPCYSPGGSPAVASLARAQVDNLRNSDFVLAELSTNVSAFLASHAVVNATFLLSMFPAHPAPNGSVVPASTWWDIRLDPCPAGTTPPGGPFYSAVANATSGAVLRSGVYGPSTC